MNQFRLRGTWEDDPAPLPFPAPLRAGRNAGATEDRDTQSPVADTDSDSVIAGVEAHLDRVTYKIDELRDLLTPFDRDPPPAA